jgi:sterol desaturase/sphingolipid hydroxylase (fatty acid hydroxylase superfamily)
MAERPLIGFFVVLFVFTPLEYFFPRHPRRFFFRKHFFGDVIHFFINNILVQVGLIAVLVALLFVVGGLVSPAFQAKVAAQPSWLQFLEAVFIAEFFGYWAHRMTHSIPWLWRFHSVHHSTEELDWLAAARLHPIDQIFNRTMIVLPLFMMGFTKETFGAFLGLSTLWAIFLHSNVRFRFRWLSFVVGTPELHHWHHSNEKEAYDKNFSGQMPLLDMLFGTFYLPKDKRPSRYGIDEKMPAGYLKQMMYPFRR